MMRVMKSWGFSPLFLSSFFFLGLSSHVHRKYNHHFLFKFLQKRHLHKLFDDVCHIALKVSPLSLSLPSSSSVYPVVFPSFTKKCNHHFLSNFYCKNLISTRDFDDACHVVLKGSPPSFSLLSSSSISPVFSFPCKMQPPLSYILSRMRIWIPASQPNSTTEVLTLVVRVMARHPNQQDYSRSVRDLNPTPYFPEATKSKRSMNYACSPPLPPSWQHGQLWSAGVSCPHLPWKPWV